jgi:hypothetical protein
VLEGTGDFDAGAAQFLRIEEYSDIIKPFSS